MATAIKFALREFYTITNQHFANRRPNPETFGFPGASRLAITKVWFILHNQSTPDMNVNLHEHEFGIT